MLFTLSFFSPFSSHYRVDLIRLVIKTVSVCLIVWHPMLYTQHSRYVYVVVVSVLRWYHENAVENGRRLSLLENTFRGEGTVIDKEASKARKAPWWLPISIRSRKTLDVVIDTWRILAAKKNAESENKKKTEGRRRKKYCAVRWIWFLVWKIHMYTKFRLVEKSDFLIGSDVLAVNLGKSKFSNSKFHSHYRRYGYTLLKQIN